MKRIWLIRHGQSKAQALEVDDYVDPELSTLGKQQAKTLEKPLAEITAERVLISPLRRAAQTFGLSGLPARHAAFDSRVIETDWNPDFYRAHVPRATPAGPAPDRHHAWMLPVDRRIQSLLHDILNGPETHIAIFGHWGIFSRLFAHFYETPKRGAIFRMEMGNAAISLLQQNDDTARSVHFWNDQSHLASLGS